MIYTTAPLPFLGQKKDFAGRFSDALRCFTGITTVVDLFGGSGLLAHTAKQARPDLRVIWNDHDNYTRRLEGIPDTNVLLSRIRGLLKDAPKGKRVSDRLHTAILAEIQQWGGVFGHYHRIFRALLCYELRLQYRGLREQNVLQ